MERELETEIYAGFTAAGSLKAIVLVMVIVI